MIKSYITLILYVKTALCSIKIENIDNKQLTVKWINGKLRTEGFIVLDSTQSVVFPFYGVSMRLWAEYHKGQPQTLFEWTRIVGKEEETIIDISAVDGIGASFNLLGDDLNIAGRYNSNVCEEAGSEYINYGCYAPCKNEKLDEQCCSGIYNTPETCSLSKITNEPLDDKNKQWRYAIRNHTTPPIIYTYAYDDKSGTINYKGEWLILSFMDNVDYRTYVKNTIEEDGSIIV